MGLWKALLFGGIGALAMGPIGGIGGFLIGIYWEKFKGEGEEWKEVEELIGKKGRGRSSNCPHCGEQVAIEGEQDIVKCPSCGHLFLANPTPEEGIKYGIGLLAKIAKVDGVVSKREAQEVGRIFHELFQLEGESFEEGKRVFNLMKNSPLSIYEMGDLFYSAFANDPKFREGFYFLIFDVAAADGGLEEIERDVLERILENLHLDPALFEKGYQTFREGGEEVWRETGGKKGEAFKILGLPEGSSWEEVKRAYRQKMKELHPDRYYNLPASAREAIEEEAKRVNWAYQYLKGLIGK
jgi:DnaJ like chaperone protein